MIRLSRQLLLSASLCAMSVASLPAHALYKVVGADGKVTYTDRPDTVSQQSKIISMNPGTGSTEATPLPLELRQPVARYPVSLYVGSGCAPCDSARSMLAQRGIPFTEKTIINNDDSDALEKLTGGREAPTMTVGSQVVRGFSPDVWGSYLDAAGYPKESRLPANYLQPPATPMVARQEAVRPQPAQRLEQTSTGIPVQNEPPPSSGIRF
ncbi:hypothetical protein BH09PSE5_BH09PSE5_34770 [soil metagenome]